ncbi:MAG: YtxH domain-containing protein [Anaerolineae bacterium]|nr:YtxH domain-containing protein [Anaerolineae bacterium]
MDEYSFEEYDARYVTAVLGGLLFLAGILLGALAGAAAMLLLAPQSGKKTRRQIRRKGKALRKQTAGTIEDGVAQVRATAHDVTGSIHEQTEALQQRGEDILEAGKERLATVVEDVTGS